MSKKIVIFLILFTVVLISGSYLSLKADKTSSINNKIKNNSISSNKENHYGYWLWTNNMYDLDFEDLSNHGVTDILLNFRAYDKYGIDKLESWISNANKKGIHIHIWVQVFWTSNDNKWVKPVIDGKPNTEFFNKKTDEIVKYSKIRGISGIHFDYLRFSGVKKYNNAAWQNPGGKESISEFVKQSVKVIHDINPNLITSAAIMPEPDSLENVYGDQYSILSEYLDVITPMVYCGNYRKDTNWVKSTTKWFVENSKKAKVWTGLQAYNNDEDLTKLSFDRMKEDINAALNAGASGVVLFRYGVSNNIDFNDF